MKNLKSISLVCLTAGLLSCNNTIDKSPKKNVLLIVVDDLRPALGCYGNEQVKSPAIDKLASQSVVFKRAYTQYPVCNPSRTSFLSGLRPERHIYSEMSKQALENHVSMPGYFKQNGYYTASIGKIYHGKNEDAKSWDYLDQVGPWQNYGNPDNYEKKPMPTLEYEDLPDTTYTDGKVTRIAIKKIQENKNKPFFIAAGFRKPHLPFAAPKKYWDLYNLKDIKTPQDISAPEDCARYVYQWSEMFAYTPNAFAYAPTYEEDDDLVKVPIDNNTLQELTHGYYACVSFIDAQINLLLTELKKQGLDKNTVVVIMADHGFQLGEQHIIAKHTCYEFSSNVPLIISDPDNPNVGSCSSLVELVDVFPSLSEICGLPAPPEFDGKSLAPLLRNLDSSTKNYAFTTYHPHPKSVNMMVGTSIRSDKFRYTEWRNMNTMEIKSKELYQLNNKENEKVNIVNQSDYQDFVSKYSGIIKDSIQSWKVIDEN
jgi:iduronate 2-sulfatase